MATTIESVQQLYIAYFNRPAEPGGLAYWVDAIDNKGGNLTDVSKAFASDTEYAAQFANMSSDQIIAKIYDNLFNRLPDQTGLNYWSNLLSTGTLSINTIVDDIASSAVDNPNGDAADKAAVNSKVQAAVKFTDLLNSDVALRLAYGNPAAGEIAKAYIHSVTNEATLATAVAALPTTTAAALLDAGQTIGNTYNLTVGVDAMTGTAGNDTFNVVPLDQTGAAKETLGSFDIIDGGAGKDTLNIYADGTNNVKQQGTVKNVETINIFNQGTAGTLFGGTDGVNAAGFAGATAVWQAGHANKIVGVGESTVAGFRATTEALSVTASGATVGIALDKVTGTNNTTNVSTLAVGGTKLTGVTVTGDIAKAAGATATSTAASLALTATVAKDAQTFTLNTAVKTTLAIDDSASAATKKVTTIAAGASTGAIKFVGDAEVTSITTGTGADNVTLASTLNATAKTATVSTGDGKDTIVVTATGTDKTVNTVTVDAGAGDDKISLTLNDNVKYNVTGGAGDDTITIVGGTVKIGDTIDGGEGKDTIALAGSATYVDDDYLVFTKVLKGFEAINFTTAAGSEDAAFDASAVAGFKEFTFDAGGFISDVAADQSVSTAGNLSISAAGYDDSGSTTKFGAALKVAVTADAMILAKGASLDLTVTGGDEAGVTAGVMGNLQTAAIHLENGVDGDDAFTVAGVQLETVAADADADIAGSLAALTTIKLDGNGIAEIRNGAGTKLVNVDASGLNSVDADGNATVGLVYESSNALAETIKLGNGIDHIALGNSVFGGLGAKHAFDTVTGLHLVANEAGDLDTDLSDSLVIAGATGDVVSFKLSSAATDIDLALKEVAASAGSLAHNTVVFTFGGDTYVFVDSAEVAGVGLIDATDTVVKLTGTYDADLLSAALTVTP